MAEEASKDEQIGFHKGALSTLSKEREEMVKILQIVESLMKAHIEELKKLGVDINKEVENAPSKSKKDVKPIEDLL